MIYKDLPVQDIERKWVSLTQRSLDLFPFSKYHEPSGGHKWGPQDLKLSTEHVEMPAQIQDWSRSCLHEGSNNN